MLVITLLGKHAVTMDGDPIDRLQAPRTLGLLAYLVLHEGARQLRQQVAGRFWPESTEAQARTNLRRELHQLRSALVEPDSFLEVDATSICWRSDAPCRLDVSVFRAAAAQATRALEREDSAGFRAAATQAVDAYRGELLPGFYDDWILVEREQLHRQCIELLDGLAAVLADGGEVSRAVELTRRRVELEPLEETGYRTLMTLQARLGDRAAALRAFHRCTSVLEHELGLEPSPETVNCYQELFGRTGASTPVGGRRQHAVPLVGRDTDLQVLHAAWAKVGEGPRLVVVGGEAGVGKTRVAAALADAVERGRGICGRARCFASRGHVALAPVAEWLRAPTLRRGVEQLEEPWRSEVGRLVPELANRAQLEPATPLGDAWQRRQFFEGLARAVLVSQEPVLLVLDDLQWCDSESLAWLEFVLHFDGAAALLVLATARSEELDDHPELLACCGRLRALGLLQEVELAPLGVKAVGELAGSLRDRPLDDAAARALWARTGGFPLFIVESVREASTGSARIEAVLASRLAQLRPLAGDLAGLAAAVGRDFSLELLAEAGGLDDRSLVAAVDELWRRRLLREHSPTTYDFSHDLLRDAAYGQLTPPHRRLLHQRIAAALERLHAGNLETVAAQVAEQHELGGKPDRAIEFHGLAARAAATLFAHSDAIHHGERALELLTHRPRRADRDRRELELREAMVPSLTALRGFARSEVGTALERIATVAERLDDEAAALRTRVALWGHLVVHGRLHDAAPLAQRLTAHAAGEGTAVGPVNLQAGVWLTALGRLQEALEHFRHLEDQSSVRQVSLFGYRSGVLAQGMYAHALWLTGQSRLAAASSSTALELADDRGDPFDQTIARAYGAITCYLLGDRDQAGELAASVHDLCERFGFAYYGEWGRILEGRLLGGSGGAALIREGIDRLRAEQAGIRMPFWLALLAEVLAEMEELGEASHALDEARTWAHQHGDRWWLAELWRLDAALHPEDAETKLARAVEVAAEQGAVALELRAATDLARNWLHAGRVDAAAALLSDVGARARDCNPTDVAAAAALLAHATG